MGERLNELPGLVMIYQNFIQQRMDGGAGFIIGWKICQKLG